MLEIKEPYQNTRGGSVWWKAVFTSKEQQPVWDFISSAIDFVSRVSLTDETKRKKALENFLKSVS